MVSDLRQELQNEYLYSVPCPRCLLKPHLDVKKERKLPPLSEGWVVSKQFQAPRRPSYFPVGVKLMGVVPDYTHGNALYFHFHLIKFVPTIFSLGNHTVFCTCSS